MPDIAQLTLVGHRADMRGEQLLHFGVERRHNRARVEFDEVLHPSLARHAREQRCIRCHAHHVAVALAPCEERRLAERRSPRVGVRVVLLEPREIAVRRILPDHDAGRITRIAVKAVGLRSEPFGRVVGVLVHDNSAARKRRVARQQHLATPGGDVARMIPRPTHRQMIWEQSGAHHTQNRRITFVNRLGDGIEPFHISFAVILVADTNHVEAERRRMTHIAANTRPLAGIRIAVGEFDEIEIILDHHIAEIIAVHRNGLRVSVRRLAGHAREQGRQRLGAQILAQAEILVEANLVALRIA